MGKKSSYKKEKSGSRYSRRVAKYSRQQNRRNSSRRTSSSVKPTFVDKSKKENMDSEKNKTKKKKFFEDNIQMLESLDIETDINNFFDIILDNIHNNNNDLKNNIHYQLLLLLCKKMNLKNNLRLKAIDTLFKLDREEYTKYIKSILSNNKEEVAFQINIIKNIDRRKQISHTRISNINKQIIRVNEQIEKIKSNFMDPEFFFMPRNREYVKEINRLYQENFNKEVAVACGVLLENYLLPLLMKNYPKKEELYFKDNGKIRNFYSMIENLFHNPKILLKKAGLNSDSDIINSLKARMHKIRETRNYYVHPDSTYPTKKEIEELKDEMNSLFKILFSFMY